MNDEQGMTSFRQRHPVLAGSLILAGIILLFWGGLSYFIASLIPLQKDGDIFGNKPGIGIVDIKGVIVSPAAVIETLSAFRKNRAVKAIVLRIDSPGGAVGASQEIFTEVKRTNAVKPIIASMGSVAASGGYYAALGAERIIASPGTITGSVGVIIKFANLEELFNKIGYKSEVIKSGRLKDIGAANRPMSEEERGLLQDLIDNVHGQFVKSVAENRAIPEEKVRKLADGRIFSGEQAKQAGLIDELGNFTDAVILAAKMADLDTEAPHLIYPKEKNFSILHLLNEAADKTLINNILRVYPRLSYEWQGIQ